MKNIYKSLAGFTQECPTIHKGTKGYGYSYADLPTIFEVINPILKKHGLGFTQLIESQTIKTVLFHLESGETIESTADIIQGVTLAKMNEFQVLGSAITYIRRYALSSMLGIVTDVDADGNSNQPKKQVAPAKPVAPIKKDVTVSQIESVKESKNKDHINYFLDNCKMTDEQREILIELKNL